MKLVTTKRLCRAGIIAALYVALTYAFGAIAYQGIVEIRPAEALCILPLFYPEAIPALYIGCMLANIASPAWIFDVFLGSFATLIAATLTYLVGRLIRNDIARIAVGGLFPVLVNAIAIPFVIFLGDPSAEVSMVAYWTFFGSLCATQAVWVYALGTPLYLLVAKMRKRGVPAFLDGKSGKVKPAVAVAAADGSPAPEPETESSDEIKE